MADSNTTLLRVGYRRMFGYGMACWLLGVALLALLASPAATAAAVTLAAVTAMLAHSAGVRISGATVTARGLIRRRVIHDVVSVTTSRHKSGYAHQLSVVRGDGATVNCPEVYWNTGLAAHLVAVDPTPIPRRAVRDIERINSALGEGPPVP